MFDDMQKQQNSERLGFWYLLNCSRCIHPTTAPFARSVWLNAIGDGSNGQYDALLGHLHDWTMDVYDYFHATSLQKGDWEQACRFRLSYREHRLLISKPVCDSQMFSKTLAYCSLKQVNIRPREPTLDWSNEYILDCRSRSSSPTPGVWSSIVDAGNPKSQLVGLWRVLSLRHRTTPLACFENWIRTRTKICCLAGVSWK